MTVDYPTALYPTIRDGFVAGDTLRMESLRPGSMPLEISHQTIKIYPDFLRGFPGVTFEDGRGFTLKNAGPFKYADTLWGITHLQKYSSWGWLRVDPDCYHRWWFWKLQQKDAQGNWLPGTERGLYFRKPFSWRWDVAGTTINGQLRHWIWTRGYLGGHWD